MDEIVLTSARARAVILPNRGALVSSLQLEDRNTGLHELLWLPENFTQISPQDWPGGGLPFLFPFAGRVWAKGELHKYILGDDVFNMPLHGFSWAKPWQVLHANSDSVDLLLTSCAETETIYPFTFEIKLRITLASSKLRASAQITHIKPIHPKVSKMPVAIGWHPYFKLESDSSLKIPAQTIYPVTSVGGADVPESLAERLGPGPWSLPHESLRSLILGDIDDSPAELSLNHEHRIMISAGPHDLMKHFVIWTNRPSDFHCVEPWMSLPDAPAQAEGVRWLKPGAHLDVWLEVDCQNF